jgi:subfamily B ATP-binding cassette protein MsbA
MKNRTTLVVAHRLSTIENADQIVVLEKGRVVEKGSHEILMGNESHYADLYRLQFKKG